jgi:hypothetical protein
MWIPTRWPMLKRPNVRPREVSVDCARYLCPGEALVEAQANRLADNAALFQALGSGWWHRSAEPIKTAVAAN